MGSSNVSSSSVADSGTVTKSSVLPRSSNSSAPSLNACDWARSRLRRTTIDRRVGHLHIEVPDLDLAFTDLAAKGVLFSHRPRMVSRGDDIELWKATFRDPDGHGIALTEWRPRDVD